ncbi:MAG: hypothetical protein GF308_14235 [Candidatus Heimdallarchaeota archaeon]|nr:hypothetical protein [Candidatus Heimdallarchaeota archaeon]
MSELIDFYHSDLMNALYYFEYHGPLHKTVGWIDQDPEVKKLLALIKKIKFPRFKQFLQWARYLAANNRIHSPRELQAAIVKNPPRGKTGEKWVDEAEKMGDILQEIYNLYTNKIQTKESKKQFMDLCEKIKKKYSTIWPKLKEESKKLPGIRWKKKDLVVCLLNPIDGRLSHKLKYSEIAFIEASEQTLNGEDLFLHEIVKLLNNTRPIQKWVKLDKEGVKAIAYELFTEMQSLRLIQKIFGKNPNFRSTIQQKLYHLWIPLIRPDTMFDEDELERILTKAYKRIPNLEYSAMYQMSELYTELRIILLN